MKDEFIKYYIGINKLFTDRVYVVIEVPNNDYKSHDAWIRSINGNMKIIGCQYHKNGVATEVNIHKRPKRNRRAKRQGYIKFDFCPFKLRDDNRKAFVYLVKRIFRYCNFNVCVHAWITKIEITTDMLDITPNDFHITVNRKRH